MKICNDQCTGFIVLPAVFYSNSAQRKRDGEDREWHRQGQTVRYSDLGRGHTRHRHCRVVLADEVLKYML